MCDMLTSIKFDGPNILLDIKIGLNVLKHIKWEGGGLFTMGMHD